MRSTNLILFLVLLNVAAGVTTAVAPGPVAVATGADAEIQGANAALGDRQVSQPSADEITGSLLGNAGIIETIDDILFLGPNMLQKALVVFGSIGVGYYMTQRSMAIPMIMFIMIGGVTIAEAPVNFQQGIVAAMVFGIAGIGFVLLQRART